jgi:hypothetical protein
MRELCGCTTIDASGRLWLPYDLAQACARPPGLREWRDAHHAGRRPFSLDFAKLNTLHIVNAMGVALGDSIVGLGVLRWLKERHPHLRLCLHRAARAPRYVEALYALAAPTLGNVRYLPDGSAELASPEATVVDVGDFAFWPQFASMPMVDFFLWALGIRPDAMPAGRKANRWLAGLDWPSATHPSPYVLFFPCASTPLRSMPKWAWSAAVDRIWDQYRLPVLGPVSLEHPRYRRIDGLETEGMERFLAWIRGASAVVSVDTAAVHAAAGFDVPCVAFMNTIAPALRTRDYPLCTSVDLRVDAVRGLHHTTDKRLMMRAEEAWHEAMTRDWK